MKTALNRYARPVALLALLALLLPLLAACGGSDDEDPQAWKIGLSYIPNIQFAPFYVALEKGYYTEAGLDVTIRNHSQDLFGALVSGDEDMIFAAGDEMLQARANDIPIVYVAEVFTQYPVALVAPADSDIQSPADLAGHSVGIPGEYGANWIGLLALLSSSGLTRDDVEIKSVGFTQVAALLAGDVDAIIGYANNEPIQLAKAGMEVRTFPVADQQPLISNGLGALQKTLDDNPDAVRAAIAATLRGVQYTIDNPEEALEISKKYVDGLDDPANAAAALEVLRATLPMWQATGKPGSVDETAWASMAAFLQEQGLLAKPIEVKGSFSNAFLP